MLNKIGIYKITNFVNNKCYIGRSKNIEKRFKEHKNSKKQNHLYNAFKEYKLENFKFEIIKECNESDLSFYEIIYIRLYCSWNPKYGYNKTYGGENNGHLTKETYKKISNSLKNQKISKEIKTKMSLSQKNRHYYTNGYITIKTYQCPEGFWSGRLYSEKAINNFKLGSLNRDENWKINQNKSQKGKHFYNNGKIEIKVFKCPKGFSKGRLKK